MTRPHLLDALRDRVLLCDGGMGSRVQALTLDVEKDYWDRENCTEVLNLSRPDMVREIHRGYFAAGADMVETNSFGGSPITLAEFDLQDRTHEINKVAGELAREAADSFGDGRAPLGRRLHRAGHQAADRSATSPMTRWRPRWPQQCAGLIDGGVDAILIETCQDTLQIKAAVNGAKIARAAAGTDTPIFVQVTVETTGTLLVGPDIAAAATVIHALDVPLIGLNCATGPQEMSRARPLAGRQLARPDQRAAQRRAAGAGERRHPLPARRPPRWRVGWSASSLEDGLNLVGGCCGTSIGISRRWTRCCAGSAATARRPCARTIIGCRRSPACTARRRCGRRTAISPSASAATPTARRSGASCRRRATGTAASPSAASRWPRAPTAWTSAPPSSAATRCGR